MDNTLGSLMKLLYNNKLLSNVYLAQYSADGGLDIWFAM
jgi:hypothetical protein